jgi:hypothetical protein
MIKQALALATHPMKDYIRIGFVTTRKGRTPFNFFCKATDLSDWQQMAHEDGETLTVTGITWERFAMGGYEIHYITADSSDLCHDCANANVDQTLLQDGDEGFDPQLGIVGADVNYESSGLHCDHCGREIQPEYEV